jgi:hypothetical protein
MEPNIHFNNQGRNLLLVANKHATTTSRLLKIDASCAVRIRHLANSARTVWLGLVHRCYSPPIHANPFRKTYNCCHKVHYTAQFVRLLHGNHPPSMAIASFLANWQSQRVAWKSNIAAPKGGTNRAQGRRTNPFFCYRKSGESTIKSSLLMHHACIHNTCLSVQVQPVNLN